VTLRRAVPLASLGVAGLLALSAYAALRADSSVTAFESAAAVIAGSGLAILAIVVRPAWTLSAALVLTSFSGQWGDLGSPVPLDRAALALGLASLLVREWRHRDGRLRTRPIDWLLMTVLLYGIVSAAVVGTLDDSHARFTLLDRYGAVPFLLFFAAPYAFRTEKDRNILIGALVGLGAYLGFTALIETTGPSALVVPHYIADPTIGIHFGRARGPFVDAVANGLALYACAVACVLAVLRWENSRWRVVAGVVGALCLLGVVLTLTRAVWIGAGAGSLIALLAYRPTRRFVVPAAVACFALVVVALAVIPGLSDRVDTRLADQQPVWDRKNSNSAAVRMIGERPLFGFGWGKFPEESPNFYRQADDYPLSAVSELHNVYLSNAVELGVLGAALWLAGLIAAIAGSIVRRGPPELLPWKIGLVAVAVSVAVAWATAPSSYVLATMLLFLWAGVARGLDPFQRP
jgi:putative inorganic carbon (HCO3(-)) transporter